MKKSELRQIIREEISSIESKERIDEGILSLLFNRFAKSKRSKIEKILANDPEYQRAVKAADEAYLKAKKITDQMLKKYGVS